MAKTKKPADDAVTPETENASEAPQEAQDDAPAPDAPENSEIAATDEKTGGADEGDGKGNAPDEDTPQEGPPEDETASAANEDVQLQPEQFTEHLVGAFNAAPLLLGGRMWRKSWAQGRTVVLESLGGRGGVKPTLMLTGARSGNLPWDTSKHDDLLASDWMCAVPRAMGSGQAG